VPIKNLMQADRSAFEGNLTFSEELFDVEKYLVKA
jgi:hypothetical protein